MCFNVQKLIFPKLFYFYLSLHISLKGLTQSTEPNAKPFRIGVAQHISNFTSQHSKREDLNSLIEQEAQKEASYHWGDFLRNCIFKPNQLHKLPKVPLSDGDPGSLHQNPQWCVEIYVSSAPNNSKSFFRGVIKYHLKL